MDVRIIAFPETKVAAVEHRGPPGAEFDTYRRLIAWRQAQGLDPARHRSYGIHYNDPRVVAPEEYRVDFCISVDRDVAPNELGVITKVIPALRCAVARHLGSRDEVTAAMYLYDVWLPSSRERAGSFPVFFHYVNVGPQLRPEEMITDVYLPLRPGSVPLGSPRQDGTP